MVALGVAGMMSANEVNSTNVNQDFQTSKTIKSGMCTITIYSIDSQGVTHIERVITRPTSSESACSGLAASISGQLSTGVSPDDVSTF